MTGALLPPEVTPMQNHYSDLVRFYAQKFNVPIEILSTQWDVDCWNQNSIAVVIPSDAEAARSISKVLQGDLVVIDDTPAARVGSNWILVFMWHLDRSRFGLFQKLMDSHLPRMCREFRKSIRDRMIQQFTSCVSDRKRELVSSLRDDDYELDRLSTQIMTLSRKIEGDRQLLRMFEKSPDFIRARATRCYYDLMKLVPAIYKSFHFSGDSVFGTTYVIEIEYDGFTYTFDPFIVECNLRKGEVLISGGTNVNGYIHMHCTDNPSNTCWGSCGHLVSRYAGSLDLHELFLLVHQFLSSYNENDPFQRIEKWNPDWCEDEDSEEPYCSWCDEYGHDVSECEECYWCEYCQHYEGHCSEDCPNRPKDEEEEEANAELAEVSTA